MVEIGVVQANWFNSLRPVRRHNRNIFSIFLNMKVCCIISLKSSHRGASNENTQYTIFNIKKKIILNCVKSAAMGSFSKGPKNEFKTAVVNEPSVSEPLKLLYISIYNYSVVNFCAFS